MPPTSPPFGVPNRDEYMAARRRLHNADIHSPPALDGHLYGARIIGEGPDLEPAGKAESALPTTAGIPAASVDWNTSEWRTFGPSAHFGDPSLSAHQAFNTLNEMCSTVQDAEDESATGLACGFLHMMEQQIEHEYEGNTTAAKIEAIQNMRSFHHKCNGDDVSSQSELDNYWTCMNQKTAHKHTEAHAVE